MMGPELAWKNRRLRAKRLQWPDGALEACERIERAHPGWSVSWFSANTTPGFERPAGYYATKTVDHWSRQEPYGETPEELEKVLR